jgi:hypothetical protein
MHWNWSLHLPTASMIMPRQPNGVRTHPESRRHFPNSAKAAVLKELPSGANLVRDHHPFDSVLYRFWNSLVFPIPIPVPVAQRRPVPLEHQLVSLDWPAIRSREPARP